MPVLRPSPRVRGLCMRPSLLSYTVSVNDMAWAQEGQYLDRTQMYECSGCLNEMSDTWARSRWHDQGSCDGR